MHRLDEVAVGMPSFAHWACLVGLFVFVFDIVKVLLVKLLDDEEKYLLRPSCKMQMRRCNHVVIVRFGIVGLGYCPPPIDFGIVTRLDVLFCPRMSCYSSPPLLGELSKIAPISCSVKTPSRSYHYESRHRKKGFGYCF